MKNFITYLANIGSMSLVVVWNVKIVPLDAFLKPKEGLLLNGESMEYTFFLKNYSRNNHKFVLLGIG